MKCPECGYQIPNGMSKCLCCGYAVKALRIVNEKDQKKEEAEYKVIDPANVHMGRASTPQGGSLLDQLFGGSIFGGSMFAGSPFGGMFQSFGSVIGDLFHDVFGGSEYDDTVFDEDDEEDYAYDALGNRIKKQSAETIEITEIEEYDDDEES